MTRLELHAQSSLQAVVECQEGTNVSTVLQADTRKDNTNSPSYRLYCKKLQRLIS